MSRQAKPFFRPATLMIAIILLSFAPSAFAGKSFQGLWAITITIPESPSSSTNRTFTVNLNVSPRDNSLHGRMTITDSDNKTVSGVWRQSGKKFSIAYELPCPDDGSQPCASLVLFGKMKKGNDSIKKGTVVVMWDTANNRNPALYDTSKGTFTGERLQ
ncbi:MAG TPA: hypothetical protein VKA70_14820 [Blastocatellia bacterium]|nr:hypothetical protein [Blastocatellia bacterium]